MLIDIGVTRVIRETGEQLDNNASHPDSLMSRLQSGLIIFLGQGCRL